MILTKGEVASGIGGEVSSALGEVDGITVVTVEGPAAVVGVGVTVGGGCIVAVVVVVVVVVAAGTVGGKGVSFLVGGGMVGVGGLNLTME